MRREPKDNGDAEPEAAFAVGTWEVLNWSALFGDISPAPYKDVRIPLSSEVSILGTGFEGGKNVGQPNQQGTPALNAPPVDWIARHKAGAELTLFYDNPSGQLPFKRIELSASGVNRYLFRNKLVFNESSSVCDIVQEGRKTWFESGLRLYLAEATNATLE
jgi:hypothetical protein